MAGAFRRPAAVASYRDHPEHVAFADTLFRPAAVDRISIDFEAVDSRTRFQTAHVEDISRASSYAELRGGNCANSLVKGWPLLHTSPFP